jgi:iron complex transport system ATP-binding protein
VTAPALIELRRATVFRGERPALEDVSLAIGLGEHVCVFGPNGCGKSTLVKTLTRECYPVVQDGSSVTILGKERWDVFELRAMLGIVSPDLLESCTTDATARDVVLSGFFSSTRVWPHHRPEPEHLAQTEAVLARLGIAHLAARPVRTMSSGEAKRTLLARALVHRPHTLVFDEPFNALDLGARLRLTATMRELARSGIGVVLVTHDVAEIPPEIQRVVVLRAGRLVADGPKHEVLTSEMLSALFDLPVRLTRDGENLVAR